MTLAELTEIETAIHSITELASVPVVFGIDPSADDLSTSIPRIAFFSFSPKENQRFVTKVFMGYPCKLCYYFALPKAYPNDKTNIALLHSNALLLRRALRALEDRQTSGACTFQIDVIDDPQEEIGISDTRGLAVLQFTLQTIEPR